MQVRVENTSHIQFQGDPFGDWLRNEKSGTCGKYNLNALNGGLINMAHSKHDKKSERRQFWARMAAHS